MKTKNTQKEIGMINAIKNSAYQTLDDVYTSCSREKYIAYLNILDDFRNLNGYRFRITSANTFSFSCGFFYMDKESGVVRCRYETRYNRYDFEVFEKM